VKIRRHILQRKISDKKIGSATTKNAQAWTVSYARIEKSVKEVKCRAARTTRAENAKLTRSRGEAIGKEKYHGHA